MDGVSGSALLYLVLKELGARVESYIPDRMSEGLRTEPGGPAEDQGCGGRLVITVDCGISAVQEAEAARSLGLDLIITDHHEIAGSGRSAVRTIRTARTGLILPDAFSILHPWLLVPDVRRPFATQVSGLTGVGVAFKLAQALLGARCR